MYILWFSGKVLTAQVYRRQSFRICTSTGVGKDEFICGVPVSLGIPCKCLYCDCFCQEQSFLNKTYTALLKHNLAWGNANKNGQTRPLGKITEELTW